MIGDAYAQHQSRRTVKDQFGTMELLLERVRMERNIHYTDDEMAAMDLYPILMMAAPEDGLWQ